MMIFGDSFSFPLVNYLARHFRRTLVSRSTVFKPEPIALHHPNIVLIEMVERVLNLSVPQDPLDRMEH